MPKSVKKKLKESASHEISAQGKLFFPKEWVEEKLGAKSDDVVLHFDIPGTKAVVLMKPDHINGLPERIKNVLKTEEELAKDVAAFRDTIEQECMDNIEARQLGLDVE